MILTKWTAHKHLDPERRKREGNPINGSICYSLLNGNTFKIVFVTLNSQMEVIKIGFRLAVSEDAKVHELPIDIFWKEFTTRKHNLK